MESTDANEWETELENSPSKNDAEEKHRKLDENSPIYDLNYDFLVILPNEIIRIPQTSNLSWLTLFYAMPKELVGKRPAYLELPRNINTLLASEKYVSMIRDDVFLELVWDCYAWAIWQGLQVPNRKGGRMDIPGDWQNYSGDFPLYKLSYDLTRYFRRSFDGEMELSFQKLFMMPPDVSVPWLSFRQFGNLVISLTERIVEQENLQPMIDEVWTHRLPEDYNGTNSKRSDFMRSWNHSRVGQHLSTEQMEEDDMELPDEHVSIERQVVSAQMVEQFKEKLSDTDRKILSMRMEGCTMQEIADATNFKTPSAVKKRIDKIAAQYEDFSNPIHDADDAERVTEKHR